ncbi:MAG: hypothetical protein J6S15_00635 [Clostridia bacterium]|nr:hypothetical protein [Clostridia bacterium]
MSEKNKKYFQIGYHIVLILLATVFVAVTLLPMVTIDANQSEYPEVYYEGRFTQGMKPIGEIDIGYGTVLDLVTNWSDFITVVGVQADEAYVKNKTEELANLKGNGASEDDIESLMEDIAETKESLDERLGELTEEDYERISEKLSEDDGFRNLVGALYSFAGAATSEDDEDGDAIEESFTDYGSNPMPVTYGLLNVLITVGLCCVALVYPIVVFCKYIVQLIYFFIHLKDEDPRAIEKRMEKFPFSGYTATFIMLFALFALFANDGIALGSAFVAAIIVWSVGNLLRAVKKILLDEENKVLAIVKQSLTVVSIVAVAILLMNFTKLGLIKDLNDNIQTMTVEHYMAELEKVDAEAAKSAVSTSNGINTAVVVVVSLLGVMVICVGLINLNERFGLRMMRLKTGEKVPYKAMYGLAIFLLVIAIIPTALFTASSEEALEEAYEAGNFKVWYTAYQEDGTVDNVEYELLVKLRDDLEEEMEDLEDEDLEVAESMLASLEERISDIESRGSRGILCIVMAVLFLLSEIAYKLSPKFIPEPKKKEHQEIPAATPTEEVFAAEQANA